MADKKISQLTSAATPLAGTEVLPIVQSDATVKVAVSDLTTGRNVSAANVNVTGATIPTNGVYLPAANTLSLATDTTERVRVNSIGRVGVNTTSPLSLVDINGKLTLSGGENAQIEISNNGQAWRINNSTAGRLYFYDATGNKFPFGIAAGAPNDTLVLDSAGNIQLGGSSVTTTATNGFPYIPTCAGTPTGTPTTKTGLAPLVVDSTNNKLYVYVGGTWVAMN